MKKSISLTLIIALFISTVFLAGVLSAQEQEEEMGYSWGSVKSISSSQIVLTEQDDETGEEVEAIYTIDPSTELQNVDNIEAIAVGSSVVIEYELVNGGRVAKVIDAEVLSGMEEPAVEESGVEESLGQEWEGDAASKTCE